MKQYAPCGTIRKKGERWPGGRIYHYEKCINMIFMHLLALKSWPSCFLCEI
ncbi:hypothetical protein GDI0246 [Gluconacetobacter diazotrophicus PA1 5]|uniref:Uncharacterized protein n=1 Tax=Gluconacetobacter diazotrophicus (strain ATCC 49037 / DSM 5601 / CCUG 37298 / CIP 103539 / LMG 7603 / PAl5) TaxID=272568 RepID=A9H2R2_GLUDA|nr:hypothetical protein GDI0246 [Gluconacetobacter diazotrophicus PA1 5]